MFARTLEDCFRNLTLETTGGLGWFLWSKIVRFSHHKLHSGPA